jgi:uncharacterized protein YukE
MADSDKQIDYDYTEMNMCFNEKHTTPFASEKNMDQMQEMVRHSNPKAVTDVAVGWDGLSKALIDVQRDFDKEVARIQEHWKGAAADRFAEKAKQVSKSLGDCAKYAGHTSTAMQNAGSVLGRIKDEVLAMEKPSALSSALNSLGDGFTRSDEGMKQDLASGKGAQAALDANHDDLSAGREAQLAMAAKMETLGAAYNSQAKAMGSWNRRPSVGGDEDIPGDPGGIPPTPVIMPTGRSPRSPQSVSPGVARPAGTSPISPSKPVAPPAGITGGAHKPGVPTHDVGTAIDGISGGRTGTPTAPGGSPVGGGSTGPGGTAGNPGLVAGAPGGVSNAVRGGRAGRAGGGVVGGADGGARAGGTAGRAGAGGIGGAAGTGAAKGGAARAGGMARQSGGVVGGTPRTGAGAGVGAGRGTAGGSGLHSSRGAAGRAAGAVRAGGMVGAPGARTGRSKDQEQREGERPDYLVEDEETWAPQRNVAPRVIEE